MIHLLQEPTKNRAAWKPKEKAVQPRTPLKTRSSKILKLKYRSTTIQEATKRNEQQELTGNKRQPATKDNEQQEPEATGNRSNSEREPVADGHKQQLKSHRQLRCQDATGDKMWQDIIPTYASTLLAAKHPLDTHLCFNNFCCQTLIYTSTALVASIKYPVMSQRHLLPNTDWTSTYASIPLIAKHLLNTHQCLNGPLPVTYQTPPGHQQHLPPKRIPNRLIASVDNRWKGQNTHKKQKSWK